MRSFLYAYIQKYYLYLCSGAVLLCLCHHDTCHSRSCIRAGGAETGTGQKNSGHTGNVHKTAIRYGTDRGADVSGNEAGTGQWKRAAS